MAEIRTINRNDLREFLAGETLRKGHLLRATWPRLTNKKVNGEIVEPKGSIVTRRGILRSDWTKPTPSGSFQPKGGIMFNVATQAQADAIKAKNDLFLLMAVEGVTHPHGEKDHPVNLPLKHLIEIEDTHAKVLYRVIDN